MLNQPETPIWTEDILLTKSDYKRLVEQTFELWFSPSRSREQNLVLDVLQAKLVQVQVIDGEVPPDIVAVGSTVTLHDLDQQEQHTLTLTWPEEPRGHNPISVLSLLGSTLLGHRLGEVFTCAWGADAQTRRLMTREVHPTPSATN